MAWPHDDPESLEAFYGPMKLGLTGQPTQEWEKANLATFAAPYPLKLSWPPHATARKVRCHRKVADSLQRILAAILAHYGSVEAVASARMHLYGGCYCYRPSRGSNRLSVHAYGAAIDLDPDRNPMGTKYNPIAGMMPQAVIDIFKKEGWTWGGDFRTRPDCMHFQAAKI